MAYLQAYVWAIIIVVLAVGGAIFYTGRWVGAVNSDRKSFNEFMKEIREKIDSILDRLPPRRIFAQASPLQLTKFGKDISACADGRNLGEELANKLVQQVGGKEAYEIQEFSEKYMKETFDPTPDQFTRFGKCAYEHGIKYEQVLEVIAIELRDKLLELTKPHYGL